MNDYLKTNIIFLGRVEDMGKLFETTHVFVFTSISNTEGFPSVITEAGAYNNLIISSNFKGVNSVINDNFNGLIYNKNCPNKLTDILENICYNYKIYKPLADLFYQNVKQDFKIETMIEKHLELYRQCCRE
jgi:glycosyltransferase involved in cell wall biosynthesis